MQDEVEPVQDDVDEILMPNFSKMILMILSRYMLRQCKDEMYECNFKKIMLYEMNSPFALGLGVIEVHDVHKEADDHQMM